MKCFARDKDGKVFEVDAFNPGKLTGIMVTCDSAEQAEDMFKQLEESFPGGRGLLEMLINEPFED